VLKYLLGRPIRWHDLAFLDPVMYESMRGLMSDVERKDAFSILGALDLNFTVDNDVSQGWGRERGMG